MCAAPASCFKICLSELDKRCSVDQRIIVPPKFGQSKSTVSFTEIFKGYFKVKTVRGSRRFSGVNINENATHLFTTRWKLSLDLLNGDGENFIKLSGVRYKILEITNIDENNEWIVFQCTERGIESQEESNA